VRCSFDIVPSSNAQQSTCRALDAEDPNRFVSGSHRETASRRASDEFGALETGSGRYRGGIVVAEFLDPFRRKEFPFPIRVG